MPQAQLTVLEGARTYSMIDRPDALAEAVAGIAVPAAS
jgi:hypothetical protein